MATQARNVLDIIERQMKLWQLQRVQQEVTPEVDPPWPLITISREYGALGRTLAEAIAKRTGFTTWDRSLIDAIAEETGANTRILASLEDKHRSAIEDAIQGALMGTAYTKSDYLKALMRIVHTIATHGGSVVVGRGAYFILEPDTNLRIRVVSPVEVRARWHAKQTGQSERDAVKAVEKLGKERTEAMRHQFKRDITDPSNFDIVVNTSSLAIVDIVDLVVLAYEAKFGRNPTSSQ